MGMKHPGTPTLDRRPLGSSTRPIREWPIVRLGEIASIGAGGTPDRSIPAYWGGSIPWVTTAQVETGIIQEGAEFITPLGLSRSAAKVLPAGTLLMALYGQGKTRGKVAILGIDAATNQACASIALRDTVCPTFVFYALASKYDQIRSQSNSGNQDNLNLSLVRAIRLQLPPRAEQEAIAAALSDVDGLIASLDRLIAKKRAIKQAAMQQLLTGKTRLPGFKGEWRSSSIADLAVIKSGATPSTTVASYWDGEIPWCTPTDITATPGKYLQETARRITPAGLASCAASLLPPGSLLLCSRATIGEVRVALRPVATNQGFKSLIPKPGVSADFLYYLTTTLKPQMIERAIGSTFLEIGKRDLGAIGCRVPEPAEQAGIGDALSTMDEAVSVLERRLAKAKSVKQGMMQALLTGRVRLPVETASSGVNA
jgi:type I restriction enzyme, S subunit